MTSVWRRSRWSWRSAAVRPISQSGTMNSSKPSAAECARRVDVASRLLRNAFAQSASPSSLPLLEATHDDAPVWNPLIAPFGRLNDPSDAPTVDQRLAARRQVARSSAELISRDPMARKPHERPERLGGSVKTPGPRGRLVPVRTPFGDHGRTIGPVVSRFGRRTVCDLGARATRVTPEISPFRSRRDDQKTFGIKCGYE